MEESLLPCVYPIAGDCALQAGPGLFTAAALTRNGNGRFDWVSEVDSSRPYIPPTCCWCGESKLNDVASSSSCNHTYRQSLTNMLAGSNKESFYGFMSGGEHGDLDLATARWIAAWPQ